jgi:hypothetical protein
MANNLTPEHLENMSLVYWLRGKFGGTFDDNIMEGFPVTDLVVPSIAVEWDYAEGYELEIGNRKMEKQRFWYIDVFAVSRAQRDDFAFKIFNDIDEGIVIYNYNQGFPPTVVPSIGTMIPISKRVQNTQVLPELTDKLYYRATVSFVAVYGKN